jgi:hypothetical protein
MRNRIRIFPVVAFFCASAVLAMSDPLTLAPTDDTFLSEGHTGKPGGRGESKEFQIFGQGAKKQFRTLLRFDLSEVKAPPTMAILRVFAFNCGNPKKTELIRCHAIVRDWSEKAASWDYCLQDDQWTNVGGDWDPMPVAGFNVPTTMSGEKGYWLEFDVTGLVQAWVLKRRPNFGLALMFDPDCTSEIRCHSKENGANAPELKLAWNAKLERGAGMVLGDRMKPYGDPVRMEPVWTTFSLTAVRIGTEFTQTVAAKGGVKPYKFSAGILPDGVKLAEDGTLSGTPTKEGKFPISFSVAGADGRKVTKTMELVVQAAAVAEVKDKDKDKKTGDGKKTKTVEEE